MPTSPYKPVVLRPLTGVLDSRSNPEDVPPLSFRMKLNFDVDRNDKLARAQGWEKLLSRTPYVNQDFHDQGDCLDVTPLREPVTFLYEATNSFGIRRLLNGTQSTLQVLNESTGQWTKIARGFGGGTVNPAVRWSTAQSGNTLILTNNFDKPQSYALGTLPAVCGQNVVAEIPELNTLKVTRAGVVAAFSGCIFLMDVTQDGSRFSSRVRWSGVNAPLRWVTAADTVANFQDLPYTETILAAMELQGNLVIFTDKSIWRAYVAGDTFAFTRVYTEPSNRNRCLVYPQSLVSDGKSLWYMGRDGFCRWDIYMAEPEATEWLWRAANLVYDTLDPKCCAGPIGWFSPVENTIYWSWPKADSGCINYRTIKANTRASTTSILDHGFTAAVNFRSDDRQSLSDWLDTYCETDFISLCLEIGSKTISEFCDECNQSQLLVAASADDYCLKQLGGGVYAREMCLNAATGTGGFGPDGQYSPFIGTYAMDGYFSDLKMMLPLGFQDFEKSLKSLLLAVQVEDLLGPVNYFRVRIGTSYTAQDPNAFGSPLAFASETDGLAPDYVAEFATDGGGGCSVLWKRYSDKPIECPNHRTNAEYSAASVRPNNGVSWGILSQARFLYLELTVIGKNSLLEVVPPTGAAFTMSSISLQARALSV